MVNVIDIVIWVFAAIGLIALTGVALYYIAKLIKKHKPLSQSETPVWPSEYHMEKLGAKCPTGWVYRGKSSSGENICQNVYNIPINDANKKSCYDKPHQNIKYFEPIKNWNKYENDPGNYRPLQERCEWIEKCGPNSETRDPTKCNAQGNWLIGGCEGTRYGCCPGTQTPKKDKKGSNCDVVSSPNASWIGVTEKC